MNIPALLVAILLAAADRVLMAYKWNILLVAKGIRISLLHALRTYLVAGFLGLLLPTTLGADAIRAYSLGRNQTETIDVAASIVVERALGLVALLVYAFGAATIGISLFGPELPEGFIGLPIAILILLGSLTMLFWMGSKGRLADRWRGFLARWSVRVAGRRISHLVESSIDSFLAYGKSGSDLRSVLALSIAENLFPILWSYSLSLALGMAIPLHWFFVLVPLVLVVRRLPISIEAIGLHEGLYLILLSALSVPASNALVLGIATHVLAVAIMLPGGYLYLQQGLRGRFRFEQPVSAVEETDQVMKARSPLRLESK